MNPRGAGQPGQWPHCRQRLLLPGAVGRRASGTLSQDDSFSPASGLVPSKSEETYFKTQSMLVCREASKKLSLLVDPINQGLAEGPNPPFTNSGPLKLTIFFANFPYLSCVLPQLCSFLLGSPSKVLLHINANLLQQLCL